jgi:hypothetical protein
VVVCWVSSLDWSSSVPMLACEDEAAFIALSRVTEPLPSVERCGIDSRQASLSTLHLHIGTKPPRVTEE